MKVGIVGLPNVGKSTLFNALTKAGAQSANYPFCTIEPNIGIVPVHDERLEKLAKIYNCNKITPATIEFVDIAGLVEGASKGEGLGNKFLSHIREVDAIAHVVRCFENDKIISVSGKVSPVRDAEVINLELILADLESVSKRLDKAMKNAKSGAFDAILERELLLKIKQHLENGKSARSLVLDEKEKAIIKDFFLLTYKPIIYVANVAEEHFISPSPFFKELEEFAKSENAEIIAISAKIEEELSKLDDDEKLLFMQELNLNMSGLEKFIQSSYKLLGLMSFLTAGEKECRAWTIKIGSKAPQAAGKIHTDFEKGFIKAEVISYDDLISCGSYAVAKEKGLVRLEGKEYIMQEGDVVVFKFNI